MRDSESSNVNCFIGVDIPTAKLRFSGAGSGIIQTFSTLAKTGKGEKCGLRGKET